MKRINTLFVCSRNQWRSPTAERIYQNDQRLIVRSRGLSKKSQKQLTAEDLYWAELVFVMEYHHKQRLISSFRNDLNETSIYVLEIPDDYLFMDPMLIDLLTERIEEFLTDYSK